jgi:hypothetical protein
MARVTNNYYKQVIRNANNLSDNTKDVYCERIDKLLDNIIMGRSLHYILLHPNVFNVEMTRYKNENISHDGRKLSSHFVIGHLTPIMTIFKQLTDFKQNHITQYLTWVKLYNKELNKKDRIYNKNQTNKYEMTLDDIETMRDGPQPSLNEKLLLSLYTMIPPLWSDYAKVRIYLAHERPPGVATDNYIWLRESRPILILLSKKTLYHTKTTHPYPYMSIDLPRPLVNVIRESLNNNPRPFLFCHQSNNQLPFSDGYFNKWANGTLKTLFNDPSMTIRSLREIYLITKLSENLSYDELKKIGQIMGQTEEIQARFIS